MIQFFTNSEAFKNASFELYFQQDHVHLVLWPGCADAAEPRATDGGLWLTDATSLPHVLLQPGPTNPRSGLREAVSTT